MAVPTEHLKTLVQIVALAIFVVQMSFALQKYLDKPLMSSPGSKTLSALQKPLYITVCKTSQFNYTHSEDISYRSSRSFFYGQIGLNNLHNKSFLTWSGPDGNLTFDQTVSILHNSSLEHVVGWFQGGVENVTKKFLYPRGVCKVYEGNPGSKISLWLKERFDYIVTVTDPAAATNFRVSDHLMTGDKIAIPTEMSSRGLLRPYVRTSYRIQLKEMSIETKDGSCIEYPNDNYESYADCVDDELQKKFLPVLECVAPWISRKNQCFGLIPTSPDKFKDISAVLDPINYSILAGQAHESDTCPQPCTILSAHSIHLRIQAMPNRKADSIKLFFDDKIKVERIVLAYDFDTLLVEIGSSLGLWLGLSVVGIFDILVSAAARFNKMGKWLQGYFFKRESNPG